MLLVNRSWKSFTSELKPWDTSGTTIHFSAKNPLPASLVKKIVKARIEENEARVKNNGITLMLFDPDLP